MKENKTLICCICELPIHTAGTVFKNKPCHINCYNKACESESPVTEGEAATLDNLREQFEKETGHSYIFGDGIRYTMWLEKKFSTLPTVNAALGSEVCEHLPVIDTGLGYYFCPACKKGFTLAEWDSLSSHPSSTVNKETAGEEKRTRDRHTKYTYYEITFKDWSHDFSTTIVATQEEVMEYLQMADTDLDDPDRDTVVSIKGIGMTPDEHDAWIEKNIENFEGFEY